MNDLLEGHRQPGLVTDRLDRRDVPGLRRRSRPLYSRPGRIAPLDPLELDRHSLAYHLTMRLSEGWAIARSAATLRLAARLFVRHGVPRGLVAFRIADTHAHVLASSDRRTAGQLALYVESALRQALRLPVPFEPARVRPVADLRHLGSAFRYVLRQEEHHGTNFDPAHDGSILPDLLGMRLIGGGAVLPRLRALLPRLARADVLRLVGMEAFADGARPIDVALAPDAAAASLGLASIHGRTAAHHRARHAAVHLVSGELSAARAGQLLGLAARSVERLRARAPEPALMEAARLQLRWRSTTLERDRERPLSCLALT
jgi:hypothetical protein